MSTFRVPLSFARKGGSAFKLPDGNREYYDQIIGAVIKTEPGELLLDPSFGTKDPIFSKGEPSGFRSTIVGYWPEIIITKFEIGDATSLGAAEISVDYEVQ